METHTHSIQLPNEALAPSIISPWQDETAMQMGSSLLISAGTEGFMNCFSDVEKWFMNQKEKCSPKLASMNNGFYSRIPLMVSFVSGKGGMEVTGSLQRWGTGTRAEARVGNRRGGPETAAVGSGRDC